MRYEEILSGQRKDPLAVFMRGALRLASLPYGVAIAVRNSRFDRAETEIHHADVSVISIGNLTTGGTGKTPLVRYVARYFRDSEVRVSIVSRGFGAKPGVENDEAMELAWSLPDVPHVQDADRVEAARIATEELETELILMDDGFQHRRLHRDLDVVVIDATNPFGFDAMLPRGLLREPISSLRRAQVVVLSRSDLVDQATRIGIRDRVQKHAPEALWSEATHAPTALLSWPDTTRTVDTIRGKKVVTVSAIGNPDAFAATVTRCGAEVVASKSLPDHDGYDRETVNGIQNWLKTFGDTSIDVICTHKDLVKLQTDQLAGHKVAALLIELEFIQGKMEFDAMLSTFVPSNDDNQSSS